MLKRLMLILVGALVLLGVSPTLAHAAVSGTMAAAITDSPDHTNFTWSCDVNPDGGTVYVMGRSWDQVGGTNTVDTARQAISGSAPVRVTFTRDGAASSSYGYRCLWYANATTTTVLGKITTALFVTTGVLDTAPVAALTQPDPVDEDVSTYLTAVDSTDAEGNIAWYTWDFGDGTTGQGAWHFIAHTYADDGTYSVTVTVFDADGLSDTDTKSIVVNDVAPPVEVETVFGSNVDNASQGGTETFAQALARQDAEYAPKVMRLFNSGMPSTSCSEQKNALAISRPGSMVSFKADPATLAGGSLDTTLDSWLSCFTVPTYVTYYHEMEDNFTTSAQKASFIAGFQHFADLVHAHSNKANLKVVVVYSDWTWDPASGRAAWTDWYPGDSYVDEIGVDVYQFKELNASDADDETMAVHDVKRPWLAAVKATGKPISVPELGYDSDTTRTAFLNDMASWADINDIRAVYYFDSYLPGGLGDHRIDNVTDQNTYKAIVAA